MLAAGSKLGPYEVVGKLGEGGMGEVYRARDTRLNREVALKILPDATASDPDRLLRFRREAQLLASLNHPNIAHLYGLEDAGPAHALIMELVEGPTLADRLAASAVPWRDALTIARQIADALEVAHEQGIIHRDLKPANIKLRDDGTVKILDFGLAKAIAPDTDDPSRPGSASNSPTLTARATQVGMILGTAAYMAPEQARGRAVDRRADIWAFGVVLYEMLSGRRAFEGDDVTTTLANVIKDDIDVAAIPADVPPLVRRLLRRCLEKDPKRRLSAIGDARLDIDEALHDSPLAPDARRPALSRSVGLAWSLAALGLLIAAAASWWPRAEPVAAPRIQFAVPTTGRIATPQTPPELSPDGRWLAYMSPDPKGAIVVHVRALDSGATQVLAGTADAGYLFWSPDSEQIGYSAGDKVLRVSTAGGPPKPVCDFEYFAGATWLPSGEILIARNSGTGIAGMFRVAATGGVPVELKLAADPGPASSYGWPVALPDGRRFLYLGWSLGIDQRAIYVGSIDGGAPVRLLAADSMGFYGAPGRLLFVQKGTLFAQTFDAASLTLSGEPMLVADNVHTPLLSGRAAVSVSKNGLLAYRPAPANQWSDLVWLDREGKTLETVGEPREYQLVRLSPDERRVAFTELDVAQARTRISILDLGNGVSSGVPTAGALPADPVWSDDSQSIAYSAEQTGRHLFVQRVGSQSASVAFRSAEQPKWLDDWSRGGKFFLFHIDGKPAKLFAAPADGSGPARLLLETPEAVDSAHFSPDGRWVAYQVSEGGVPQVWVASFPAFEQRRQVSARGGGQAMWRRDGQELFYLTPAGRMMSVRITTQTSGALDFAPPVELFQSPFVRPWLEVDQYSVSKDGQRFLFIRPREMTDVPITVLVNWSSR